MHKNTSLFSIYAIAMLFVEDISSISQYLRYVSASPDLLHANHLTTPTHGPHYYILSIRPILYPTEELPPIFMA